MARAAKTAKIIEFENKSHRTKAELECRKQAEQALLTGVEVKEWKECRSNPISHKEFKRVVQLFKVIDKNDALYEGIINRYCILKGEIAAIEDQKQSLNVILNELNNNKSDMIYSDYIKLFLDLTNQINKLDATVMQKRKMQFDIEKENLMTIASAMRSIPKKPVDNNDADPMSALLEKRM